MQRKEYIKYWREKSTNETFVVAQIDCSMNDTLVRQSEVQPKFFSQHQATVFTTFATARQQQHRLFIVQKKFSFNSSRRTSHWWKRSLTSGRFYFFLRIKNFDESRCVVPTIFFCFRDGASVHLKNNASTFNLIHHKVAFRLETCWTFIATGQKTFLFILHNHVCLGKIQGVRSLHDVQPVSAITVQCRSTSPSTRIRTYSFQ